jgi:hypothetical protein
LLVAVFGKMVYTDTDDTDSDDDQETGTENNDSLLDEETDDNSDETESNSTESTVEDVVNELLAYFDNNLQLPIVLNPPHQLLSNIFVMSRRFGCIICIYKGCGTVVGSTQCYEHLQKNIMMFLTTFSKAAEKL